jgi:LuxR family transcriptional regulator, maltose regulon positive regulatory protein
MLNDIRRPVAIEAKHLRPQSDHVSLRRDTLEAFAAAFGLRLTVVCAPAGYGKTSTTAAALERCGRAAAWYKLDILDNDPLAFLAAMTRAVRGFVPDFGGALLRELESGPILDAPVEALAAQFCSECDASLSDDLHLVLDDYHEAMDSNALNDVLGYLLHSCPSHVRFVVLTRYEPAFRLEKLRLEGQAFRLPRELLLFDDAQVADVLAARSGRRHDPLHVRRLLELTEGWPASIVLAGLALNWLDVASLQDALGDPRLRGDVFSYLAEQVFQRQAVDVQDFLLATCCLEHVTAELGETITASGRASRHLHFLAHNHIFTFQTETAGAYRYHNLLRDFLRQRFVQEEGEAAFRALQRRTAAALEECGDRPGATELLLGANELDLALTVISRGGEAELERRPSEQLRLWVNRLSGCVEAESPWALVVEAVLQTREGSFSLALENLRQAKNLLVKSHVRKDLYEVLSITEWAEFWSGDSASSILTSYEALELATSDGQRLHTLLSLMSAGVDMRRWDDVAAASAEAEMLLPHASATEAARARALRAHAAFYQGDMRSAKYLLEGQPLKGMTIAQSAASLNTLGMIHTALADYDSARSCLSDANDTARGFGRSLASHVEDNLAFLDASVGHSESAIEQLERILGSSPSFDPTMLCSVLMHKATTLRRAGNPAASLIPAREALATVSAERDPYLAQNSRVNLAFAEGLLGADLEGTLLLASSAAAASGLSFVAFKAQMYAGILAWQHGRADEAVKALEECLPAQLSLGHINLVAQEVAARPAVAALVLRRHRSNGLGLPLLTALSRHWDFPAFVDALKGEVPSQIGWWASRLLTRRPDDPPMSVAPVTESDEPRRSAPTRVADLTRREAEVVQLMAKDYTNEEIAHALYVSIPTVKTHVNHIFRKLGRRTRVGVVLEYERLTRGRAEEPRLRRNQPPP